MKAKRILGSGIVALSLFALVGCQPSGEEMAAMMKQPPRPAELNRLEAFVGNWAGDCEVKMGGSDEVHTSHGSNSWQWAVDKWMLVEHWEHDMGETDKMKGVNLMWWDASARKYRMTGTDNYGGHMYGTMTFNENKEQWQGRFTSRDGETGEKTIGKFWTKFTNPSTQEWVWEEFDGLGLFKFMEVAGTSKRQ